MLDKSSTKGKDDKVADDENSFPVMEKAKCLSYLWKQNLSSRPMIEDQIQKARKAFFQFGSVYAFQGNLSCIILFDCAVLCSPYTPIWSGKLDNVL